MTDLLERIGSDLDQRTTGPLHFRMLLQPAMAILFAALDGWKDARAGRPPYFWSLLSSPAERSAMIRDGWHSIGKVFLLAVVLDAVYQFMVQRFIYVGELAIVAVLLAIAPYLILRGLVTRVVSQFVRSGHPTPGRAPPSRPGGGA